MPDPIRDKTPSHQEVPRESESLGQCLGSIMLTLTFFVVFVGAAIALRFAVWVPHFHQ